MEGIIFEHVPYEDFNRPRPGEAKKEEQKPFKGAQLLNTKTRQVLYLKKGEELFMRVSMDISDAETKYTPQTEIGPVAEEFYSLLASLEMLPNSLTLLSAGRELHKLYACFTLPVDDSMESIFEAIRETASINRTETGATLSVTFWKGKKRSGSYFDTIIKTPDKATANIRILL